MLNINPIKIENRGILLCCFIATFMIVMVLFSPVMLRAQWSQKLYIKWVGVIDNGEGNDWPHGPLGNLHVQLYDWRGKEYDHFILTGPSKKEFRDGDQAWYSIYIGSIMKNRPLYLKIWESDPGGRWLGRKNDVLFQAWITNPGLWYSGKAAPRDARNNAIRRGANNWAKKVWRGGIRPGIPKMFIKIESR